MEEFRKLHDKVEQFQKEMRRRRTKTVSDEVFKSKVKEIFTEWKTQVKPRIERSKLLGKVQIRNMDHRVTAFYKESTMRIADTKRVLLLLSEINELLFKYLLLISTKTSLVSESREDLLKRLAINLEHFKVASDYFEEAKSCFNYGLLRAATIMAISALESCLKTDFLRIKGEEFDGKLFDLLNIYFSGNMKRLPKQYEDFSKTYVKIRNSFTHPEEFDYSENLVFAVLTTVAELMKAIEKHY